VHGETRPTEHRNITPTDGLSCLVHTSCLVLVLMSLRHGLALSFGPNIVGLYLVTETDSGLKIKEKKTG
jgi:hypothetical protein